MPTARGGILRSASPLQACDFCRSPRSVLSQLAALERSLERATGAEADAAAGGGDPFERCDCGSGGERGTEEELRLQQGRRRRAGVATPALSDSEGAGSPAAATRDPFASARTLAQRSVPAAGDAGARARPAVATAQSAPHTAAAQRVPGTLGPLPARAAAGAGQADARQPLKPILPNRFKRPALVTPPSAKQQQQQLRQGKTEPFATGPCPAVGASDTPAEGALVGTAAGAGEGAGAHCTEPASAPAALGGPASRTGSASAGGDGGGKKPFFRAFKAPRRLGPC